MLCVREAGHYAVFDDVLAAEDALRLWEYIQVDDYAPPHRSRWEKAWRLSDGEPMLGVLVRHVLDGSDGGPATSNDGRTARMFPTHGGIDALIRLLLEQNERLVPWIGRMNADWKALTARPYLYPAGTALSWHTDAISYTGAFVYYAHRQWSANWGGELLIAHESTSGANLGEKITMGAVVESDRIVGLRRNAVPPALDHEQENRVLMSSGLGEYVMAKPNRLVIMKSGTPHRIARIDPSAGDSVRCSIGGCFLSEPTR